MWKEIGHHLKTQFNGHNINLVFMTLEKYKCIALSRIVARVVRKAYSIINKINHMVKFISFKNSAFNYIYEYAHLIWKENNKSSHYSLLNYVFFKQVCLAYKQSFKWKGNHSVCAFAKINSTLSIVKQNNECQQKSTCIRSLFFN